MQLKILVITHETNIQNLKKVSKSRREVKRAAQGHEIEWEGVCKPIDSPD